MPTSSADVNASLGAFTPAAFPSPSSPSSPLYPPAGAGLSGAGGDPERESERGKGPSDGIVEQQHFLEVADYVTKLKLRVDKLLLATSALVKHSGYTASVLAQFAAVVSDMDEAEAKAVSLFYDDDTHARAAEGHLGSSTPASEGVRWMAAARLFSSASGPPKVRSLGR